MRPVQSIAAPSSLISLGSALDDIVPTAGTKAADCSEREIRHILVYSNSRTGSGLPVQRLATKHQRSVDDSSPTFFLQCGSPDLAHLRRHQKTASIENRNSPITRE